MPLKSVDTIARVIATSGSRRALLAALTGGLLGLASLSLESGPRADAAKPRRRRPRKPACPKARRCGRRCCTAGRKCRQGVCRLVQTPGPPPQPTPGPGPGPDPGPARTRYNVHSLDANGAELQSLARGVATMMQRQASDPTSWLAQANIHWNSCRHGSVHFLSWHRMYIYWFERILRRASGDDSLTLPYWDYSNAGQRVLPAPFRDPNNALYIAERNPEVNAGQQPNPAVFNMPGTMEQVNFMHAGSGTSFGGATAASGRVESAPHNGVHTWVGGSTGFMGRVQHAAKDPVFWLHHANIDRMWEAWLRLGGGRANTNDPAFLNTAFQFYDENGAPVSMTGSQILDTANQLGYRYDDQPMSASRSIAAQGRPSLVAASKASSTVLGATAPSRPLILSRQAVEVVIPIDETRSGALGRSRKRATPRTTLAVNGIAGAGIRGVLFEVYVGANGGRANSGRGTNVGSIGLFGLHPDDHNGHGHSAGNVSFDITDAVAGAAGARKITVTLVPVNLTGAGSLPNGTLATIDRMIISVQGAPRTAKQKPAQKQEQKQSKKARLAKKAKQQKQKPQRKTQRKRATPQKPTVNERRKRREDRKQSQSPVGPNAAAVPRSKSSALDLFPSASTGGEPEASHANH